MERDFYNSYFTIIGILCVLRLLFFLYLFSFILFGLYEFCRFGLGALSAVTHVFHSHCQISGSSIEIITLGSVIVALSS